MGQEALFIETVSTSQTRSFNELKSELNTKLLKKTAELLGITTEVSEQEISQWKIKYIANLLTNQEMIKSRGDEDNLEFSNGVLRAVFEGRI